MVGAGAVIVSQVVILTSWSDARYGTIANIVALVGVALGFLSQGPSSFRAEYDREIAQGLGRAVATPLLTEADLAQLPTLVQRYIRLNGAVGQPRVQNFRARFHGQIRSGPSARWMSFTGEQYNFYDQPSRLFLMDASMFGVPFQVFHRFVGPSATMRVKVASVVTMVDAKGSSRTERSERRRPDGSVALCADAGPRPDSRCWCSGHSPPDAAVSILRVTSRTALETWKVVRSKLRTRTDEQCLRLLRAAIVAIDARPTWIWVGV